MENKNWFAELSAVNVDKLREKKGRFDYLSWAVALRELKKVYPKAHFEVIKYDNKPYCATESGFFVEVAVTIDGLTQSQIHPVLDNANRPIAKPNAFQINTSIQRCLAKAIALHGLGLSLFAGEDLVQYDEPTQTQTQQQSQTQQNYQPKQQNTYKTTSNAPASEAQKNLLRKKGVNFPEDITKNAASDLIKKALSSDNKPEPTVSPCIAIANSIKTQIESDANPSANSEHYLSMLGQINDASVQSKTKELLNQYL
jgi:hypothetical protein